jgi:ABC-2 type transport system permease protein
VTDPRVFWDSCLLQYRMLFSWGSPAAYAASKVLMPVFQLLFFVELGVFATGRSNIDYFVVGNALQLTAVNGIYGVVMAVGNERRYGTLPFLFGSPVSRSAMFLGKAFFHVLDGAAGVVVGFVVASAVFGLPWRRTDWPALALCVATVAVTTSGLGLALGSLALVTRDVLTIGNIAYYLLLLLCGVNFPVSLLPAPAQLVAQALPMTRGIAAARLASAGAPLAGVLPLLGQELAVGLAYGVAGYAAFRYLERLARKSGALESL